MKVTIDGKRYNSEKMETLGKREHYNHSNTYSGTTYLLRSNDGLLFWKTESNGQDCYLTSDFGLLENSRLIIDDFDLDENQEKRCVELGLIQIV